eukprot:GFUD01032442.1.p1 GENE.GFUD01032442.1~~GFUD01032442.1.p1  ORF type:complete len:490 (-),score=122.18 GFUD01032442.1:26-1495(-)
MASSSTSSDSRVRYTMVDKISGKKVGVLVCKGHEVPDLEQMELKICPAGTVEQKWPVVGDPFIRKELDINGNKSVSSKSEDKDGLKEDLLRYQQPLRFQSLMKPFQFGWLRRVTTSSSDQHVTNVSYMSPPDSEGRRKRFAYKVEIGKYLKETQMDKNLELDNFCVTRNVLGLSSEFECVQYGGVHRLPAAANNKVAMQEIVEGNASKCDNVIKDGESVQIERDNVVATNLDLDFSCDTLVGDLSSSGTMSSADSSTDDNADSDRSLNDFEDIIFPLTDFDSASRYKINSNALNIPSPVGSPQVVSPPSSPFLTINNADIPTLTAEPRDIEPLSLLTTAASSSSLTLVSHTPISSTHLEEMNTDHKSRTASLFPPSDVTSSPSNLTSVASFYTSAASYFPPAPCQAAIPSTRVMLVMVSTESGDGERSRKQATLMIKSGVKVEKAMKKFGKMFGLDFRKLIFMSDTKQLTGEELAGGLDGAQIRVEGMN